MHGGNGADTMYGGADDDYLNGGTRNRSVSDGKLDTMIGGSGKDYFRFEEVSPLSVFEYLMSDFVVGSDKKP